MSQRLECDVLVVGAGPAGSSAAAVAANLGARVVIIDKRSEVGLPVQCAEHIPKPLAMEIELTADAVAQQVAGTKVYIDSKKVAVTDAPGYILNRDVFDRSLASEAVRSGARLMMCTTAVARSENSVLASQNGSEMEINCRIIIGADGPTSTVGGWIDQRNSKFVKAIQSTVSLSNPLQYCEIYFEPEFNAGYGWLFPKGDVANVGIGVVSTDSNLSELLDRFLERLGREGKISEGEVCSTAGLIPVGGSLPTLVENVMLVGDAAGQTHPISGAGIPQAVVCGKLAGRSAARAVLEEDMSQVTVYEREWTKLYGSTLDHACRKRETMEAEWNGRNFTELIRRSWIGFKEYYRTP